MEQHRRRWCQRRPCDALLHCRTRRAAGGGVDLGAIVGQLLGGGAGGAILTVIAGLVKSMIASEQTH
jgi:hypothetical protein